MSRPALVGSGLMRRFGGGAGVHGIDITVARGEVHALVGLNGAGKTTLLRLLLGMLRPDVGTVEVLGTDLAAAGAGAGAAVWRRVGHAGERAPAYRELDTRTNLELAARLRGVAPQRVSAVAADAMTELDLHGYAAVRARRLSQGNRQRLGLAAALQHHPELIVLDEPTGALDPAGMILLRELLLARAAAGAGILVSSHHLDEVARIADRITVVNHGRVVGELDPTGVDLERAFFAMVHADDEGMR